MQYITIKRFKRRGIGGQFNIPYGTPLELHDDGKLYYKDLPVCVAKSAASHEHFARDNDGDGRERGKLSHAIIHALEPNKFDSPQERDEFWKLIWNDPLANNYRRKETSTIGSGQTIFLMLLSTTSNILPHLLA